MLFGTPEEVPWSKYITFSGICQPLIIQKRRYTEKMKVKLLLGALATTVLLFSNNSYSYTWKNYAEAYLDVCLFGSQTSGSVCAENAQFDIGGICYGGKVKISPQYYSGTAWVTVPGKSKTLSNNESYETYATLDVGTKIRIKVSASALRINSGEGYVDAN